MMNIAVNCFSPRQALVRIEDAISVVQSHCPVVTETESVSLLHANTRILSRDATACISRPARDLSAMDGYAFSFDALGPNRELRLSGHARAGHPYYGRVALGDCVAVATGAEMPDGCDTVAMLESCDRKRSHIAVRGVVRCGANVRKSGEDFSQNAVLLSMGTRLGPQSLAVLASAGIVAAPVFRRLRVAVISIGDELSAVRTKVGQRSTIDVNRIMLLAACEQLGFESTDLGIVPDERHAIGEAFARATSCHDAVISTAGTSVGREDHTRGAIKDCGGHLIVSGVAMKPGKPAALGKIDDCLCIALPGNPAAAFVTFTAVAIPILRHIAGEAPKPDIPHIVRAGFAYKKKLGLREYLRVTLRQSREGVAEVAHCSKDKASLLSAFAEGSGFISLSENVSRIEVGELVPYRSYVSYLR